MYHPSFKGLLVLNKVVSLYNKGANPQNSSCRLKQPQVTNPIAQNLSELTLQTVLGPWLGGLRSMQGGVAAFNHFQLAYNCSSSEISLVPFIGVSLSMSDASPQVQKSSHTDNTKGHYVTTPCCRPLNLKHGAFDIQNGPP